MIKRSLLAVRRRIDTWLAKVVADAIYRRGPYDYVALAYLKAGMEAADFFREHMALAEDCKTKAELLEFAASKVENDGLWLEFGVFRGRDIRVLSHYAKGKVYGFDSFEGLPEDWTFFQRKGRFSLSGQLPHVPENVELIKGWFDQTLPDFMAANDGPIAFLHVDSDLYSSARHVLFEVYDRLQVGTIILFDDFLNYPDWKNGEAKAFFELIEEKGLAFQYLGFASRQQAVALRLIGDGPPAGVDQ